MVETLKVNLDRTALILKIAGIVAGGLIACGLAYGQLDARIDANKLNHAVSKAVQETQLESMGDKIDLIYDMLKEQKSKD